MASIVNYKSKTGLFHQYMFVPETMNSVSPIAWWHSPSEQLTDRLLMLIDQLLSATSSCAGFQRVFSTFRLVHSKLGNRLGMEKADKLVFTYKMVNKKSK